MSGGSPWDGYRVESFVESMERDLADGREVVERITPEPEVDWIKTLKSLQVLIWTLWVICAIATVVAFIWFPEHAELWSKVALTQLVVFGIPSALTLIRLNYLRRAKK